MRMLTARGAVVLFMAIVLLAVAAVALAASQPTWIATHSGAVPDVQCPAGVSPAQSFCYVTAPPNGSKAPDTNVAPPTGASTAP